MTNKNKKNGAFLIELLIAIGIMAVFTGTALMGIAPQLQKARDTKVKEDFIQIRNALTQYYDDVGCFPQSLPTCGQTFSRNTFVYFSKFPCDWFGKEYVYEPEEGTCPKSYRVLTNLENVKDKSIDTVGCRFGCGQACLYNYGISSTNLKLNEGCVQQFACSPDGSCIIFSDPQASRCPATFDNDPSCENQCSKRSNQCHDERGKKN